jgi:N-acetylneuraminic acid mutarotase
MLAFNLANKIYSTTIPDNFEEFSAVFDPETSVQYNTLEGLFVIPSNKSNKLYYYSSKKNIINDLFSLKENHSGGCLFLDNSSKYIIALGGYESKAVEKFAFETGKLEQLPEMSTYRSKISCNQIGNKIYCFFGISKEKPNKSIVECLDLDNIEEGWKEIDFINDAGCDVISGMSCINLNDNELLIIGGLINDKIPNEKLLYFNIEEKKLKKIEKNLPDSDDKVYIFTQNTMFNLFVNGEIISFANIDNNNHVHILDNDLCYDLYLTPTLK